MRPLSLPDVSNRVSRNVEMASNVIDQPAKANEDRLNMKAYADALTEFIANSQE